MQKIGLFLLAAAFTAAAHAQIQTLALTSTAPSTGACMADSWVEVSSGSVDWFIESPSGFVSASGTSVSAGGAKDVFTIANNTGTTGQILDVTKGVYLSPSAAGFVASSTPFTWDFMLNGSCAPTSAPPSGGTTTTTTAPPPVTGGSSAGGPTTVAVMFVGDSITQGQDTTAAEVQGGDRCAWYFNSLAQLGSPINMVGTSNELGDVLPSVSPTIINSGFPGCPSNAQGWSGFGGLTISQIVFGGVVPTTSFEYPGALEDISTLKPKVIVFQGGTNDIFLNTSSATPNVTANLTSALNAMFSADPGVAIVVSQIPPFIASNYPTEAAQVPAVNAQIAAVVASLQSAGQKVMLDSSWVGVAATVGNFPDNCCHPGAALYIQRANSLANEMISLLRAIASGSPENVAAVINAKAKTAVTLQAMVTAHPASN
jgi:lysophospholipase L1-like esterase